MYRSYVALSFKFQIDDFGQQYFMYTASSFYLYLVFEIALFPSPICFSHCFAHSCPGTRNGLHITGLF